ncbi:MAG: aminotransferase class I/II-fold pyridoxal phosphate-dependent enzyme [Cyclobacteriaceae bacterium]|nr:aminotransferase class I/II-fold pyridoxal phosphate-dependent enzyme [Cyclobacteriaceae bacterium]
MQYSPKEISEIINSHGEERDLYYNSVAPPIMQSSNFAFRSVRDLRESLKKEDEIPFYTRGVNPTSDILRKKMAALEHTEDSLIFASGSAAIAAAVMANLHMGEHVVCVNKPYSWTKKLLNDLLSRFGVEVTFVDGTRAENFSDAIRENTRMFYLESPNSWTFEMQDIETIVKIARKKGILTLIDNSYASPINQTPADYGADIILHSASKYISGHSDTVAGILCASEEMTRRIFESEFMTLGGIIAPFNSWLLLRGLRTLPIRMERIAGTTGKVTQFLEKHRKVKKVYYPFLQSHPQLTLAKKQMKMGGGLFTIELKTEDPVKIEEFCNSLRTFLLACSWGGHESLIYPAIVLMDSQNYHKGGLPLNMIRIYVGLEDPDYLINDLSQALDRI